MMYKTIKIFYLLLCIPAVMFSQTKENIYKDGPYLFLNPNQSVRVISAEGFSSHTPPWKLLDTVYANMSALGDIQVSDDKGHWVFPIKNSSLQGNRGEINGNKPLKKGEKIFAISDSHGNFKNFIAILQKGEVINEKLGWNYGKNRLVILGDTFDRGNDVLAILWLIYTLQEQAADSGGSVSYLLGNHDNMVLKGDVRYIKSKYKKLQDTLAMPYAQFFGEQSVLGKWLRDKKSIEIIGNTLFVHGGISPAFAQSGISVETANELIGKYLDAPKDVYQTGETTKDTLGMVKFLFGTEGPLWYRGLVSKDEKYNPITEQEVSSLLQQYKVSRIVVGHTTFEGVQLHHNGKVISVDSENEKLDIDHLAQGLEIVGNKIKIY